MARRSIAHVITGLDTGGAEMMLLRLLTKTNRERWQPSVVCLRRPGTLGRHIEQIGVRVATLAARGRLPSFGAVWRLRREMQALAPAVIQGWMYHGNLAALAGRALGRLRIPVLWNIRNTVFDFASLNRLTAILVRVGALLSPLAARIIYNSRSGARQHADLGYATEGSVVIPNGFDTDTFAPSAAARAAFRRGLGVDEQTILIGRVGRYDPLKDYPVFLKAAAVVAQAYPGTRFVLAGQGVDHANAELARLLDVLGLGGAVFLLGEVMPANELMASLDIACSSSNSEGFPNVVGEAMACGVPCVATDVGDSDWILGGTGMVVPPRDPRALAAACGALVDAGPEARRRLGAEGRTRVMREFSLGPVVAQYEALYQETLG